MPAKVNSKKCTGCESCVVECPSEAIVMVGEKERVDVDNCIDCGICVESCPEEAISLV